MSTKRRPYSSPRRRFDIIWLEMSVFFGCDAIDSAEYERVWKEWQAAGCPAPIIGFIRNQTNGPPSPFSVN